MQLPPKDSRMKNSNTIHELKRATREKVPRSFEIYDLFIASRAAAVCLLVSFVSYQGSLALGYAESDWYYTIMARA